MAYGAVKRFFRRKPPGKPAVAAKKPKKPRYRRKTGLSKRPLRYSRPTMRDPHGLHRMFDACNQYGRPLAVPGAVGNSVCLDGVSRGSWFTNGAVDTFLVVQWTPSATKVIGITAAGSVTRFTCPQLTSAAPTQIKPLRLSVRLRCTTQFSNIGGIVRSLNSPQQVDWAWPTATTVSAGTITQLTNAVLSNPNTVTVTNMSLEKTKVWIAPPASTQGFTTWYPFDDLSSGLSGQDFINGADYMATNTVILHFPANATTQTYDFSVHIQDATRHQLSSVYSNLAMPAPAGMSTDTFAAAVHTLQKNASQPVDEQMLAQSDGTFNAVAHPKTRAGPY